MALLWKTSSGTFIF